MTTRKMIVILAGTILLALAAFLPQGFGAAPAATPSGFSIKAVGIIDPAKIQEKFPDYVRLMDLKAAYDREMKSYQDYQYGMLQSYQTELKRRKDSELEGKSEAEKKAIEAKYTEMAQAKQNEIKDQITAKFQELQDKLNAETTKADATVQTLLAEICKEKGIVLVLNKSAVYMGGTDISDEVIARGQSKQVKK